MATSYPSNQGRRPWRQPPVTWAVRLSRLILVLGVALAATVGVAPANAATSSGCSREYSYAGFQSATRGYGVAAEISAQSAPDVASGHVAGWVGVGGVGWGPNGTSEWLQVGLAAFAGDATSELYYEVTRPHDAARLHIVKSGIRTGQAFKLGVLEMAHRRSWWRVWVN